MVGGDLASVSPSRLKRITPRDTIPFCGHVIVTISYTGELGGMTDPGAYVAGEGTGAKGR